MADEFIMVGNTKIVREIRVKDPKYVKGARQWLRQIQWGFYGAAGLVLLVTGITYI